MSRTTRSSLLSYHSEHHRAKRNARWADVPDHGRLDYPVWSAHLKGGNMAFTAGFRAAGGWDDERQRSGVYPAMKARKDAERRNFKRAERNAWKSSLAAPEGAAPYNPFERTLTDIEQEDDFRDRGDFYNPGWTRYTDPTHERFIG